MSYPEMSSNPPGAVIPEEVFDPLTPTTMPCGIELNVLKDCILNTTEDLIEQMDANVGCHYVEDLSLGIWANENAVSLPMICVNCGMTYEEMEHIKATLKATIPLFSSLVPLIDDNFGRYVFGPNLGERDEQSIGTMNYTNTTLEQFIGYTMKVCSDKQDRFRITMHRLYPLWLRLRDCLTSSIAELRKDQWGHWPLLELGLLDDPNRRNWRMNPIVVDWTKDMIMTYVIHRMLDFFHVSDVKSMTDGDIDPLCREQFLAYIHDIVTNAFVTIARTLAEYDLSFPVPRRV
jgi:hypothetical protein